MHRLGRRRFHAHLVALIDDHTEYFHSHLDHLGKTERRICLALIDLWRPSTTAEIAAGTLCAKENADRRLRYLRLPTATRPSTKGRRADCCTTSRN